MIFAAFLLFANSALADVSQPLLTATSDAFSGECRISLLLDDDLIAQALEAASISEKRVFPIEGLNAGIVLVSASDQDVIVLQGETFDPRSGGELKLTYLVNGISGKKRTVAVAVERTGSKWNFLADDSAGRRIVENGFFKANKLFGKIVGIASVVFR